MKARNTGFTLIELLLVLVILGTLAAIVVPQLAGEGKEAKLTATKNQIKIIDQALERYEQHNDKYPSTEQGLAALITQPSGDPPTPGWKGPYLKSDRVPKDPWGNEYQYKSPGEKNTKSFDLWSYGPDGKQDGGDDIANWTTDDKK